MATSTGPRLGCRLHPYWVSLRPFALSAAGTAEFPFGSDHFAAAVHLYSLAHFHQSRRRWLAFSLLAGGCLGAANATLWTIVLPLLATLLLILALLRAIHEIQPASSGPTAWT